MQNELSPAKLYAALQRERFVIAGPCVLESLDLAMAVAEKVKDAAAQNGVFAIFKSSFDKANRSSASGFRGPGMKTGLAWLAEVKEKTGLPVITDIHEPGDAALVSEVADVLQIPAFLCRQTSLLKAAAKTGRVINIKKGQFMAPWDMGNVLDKMRSFGNQLTVLTERGTTFGYNNLVVDMRSIPIMSALGVPVVMDATHSVQLPGAQGGSSGGDRKMVPHLALAAAAAGCHGVFLECHPDPDKAMCDGPNSLILDDLDLLLRKLSSVWSISHAK